MPQKLCLAGLYLLLVLGTLTQKSLGQTVQTSDGTSHSQSTLRIAVASNFRVTLEQLVAHYQEADSGKSQIEISAASTGKLTTQILHGAPYALFFAADEHSIEALSRQGLVNNDDRMIYAIGQLALWQPEIALTKAKPGLDQPFACLAIANARLAPYGAAAEQVLAKTGLTQESGQRIIRGQSVSQVYQFVASQNCQAGLVALSQVITNGIPEAQWWRIPHHYYTPIHQHAALLQHAREHPPAVSFWAFLKTPAAARIIEAAGYQRRQNN